jgi:hypothetical protein
MEGKPISKSHPSPLGPSQEIIMHAARNASIVLALGLALSGAIGGEIEGAYAVSIGTVNTSAAFLATARQNIGVVEQSVTNNTVIVNGAANTAAGLPAQSVSRATQNGKIANSDILGQGLNNTAAGFLSTATQEGRAKNNGMVLNSAAQRTGVAE